MDCNMEDTYRTIKEACRGLYIQQKSRFIAFAYPVSSAGQVREIVAALRKEYYDARHCCYAYRIGPGGEEFRASDDGEPSSSAGRPILGQLLSRGLTNILIVVVRYFGGVKLGVPGLINAYTEAACDAISGGVIVECVVEREINLRFGYSVLNDVMRRVKEYSGQQYVRVIAQRFDNICVMRLAVLYSALELVRATLSSIEGVEADDVV